MKLYVLLFCSNRPDRQISQTNFLLVHGSCTVLGLNVPCPYFVQEILLGDGFFHQSVNRRAGVARLLIAAEVSERDETFVRMLAGPESGEWWYRDDPEHYPLYSEVLNIINEKIQAV